MLSEDLRHFRYIFYSHEITVTIIDDSYRIVHNNTRIGHIIYSNLANILENCGPAHKPHAWYLSAEVKGVIINN